MTVAREMNNGVALLLERMKTNPEEFVDFPTEKHISSKWGEIISDYESYLEPEDLQLLKNGLKAIHQQRFTEKILEELVDPKKSEKWETVGMVTSNMPSAGQTLASSLTTSKPWVTAGVLTANSNTLTIGNTTINESHLEHLRAHVDAMKREVDSQELKKPKTIFGRLFNYQ